MQIQLKQPEIVAALKLYIAQQGINLDGKSVVITFTAGRKEAGTSADIVIEDAAIPGFTNASADVVVEAAAKPALNLVKLTAPAVAAIANDATEKAKAPVAEAQVAAEPAPETDSVDGDGFAKDALERPIGQLPEAEAAPAKTASLFG